MTDKTSCYTYLGDFEPDPIHFYKTESITKNLYSTILRLMRYAILYLDELQLLKTKIFVNEYFPS